MNAPKPDPPVRADGKCACGCGKMRKPERSRKYGGVEAERDPFASTECCRRYHGCPVGGREEGVEDGVSTMPDDDERHGTTYGYHTKLCRCDRCKNAWRNYQKKRRLGNLPAVAA